ncbi:MULTISPECIES: XRE family transcriptional regulator [unclassified Pseudomonas]|uniref:XRE family transcriptional regulator n=1 Tax=unclassified Pseudomonas TaxID=196821 RepID=UPI0011ED6C0E|nr:MULTISPECIES: XRE family transcriptional regulator [unclassified Pseudomonas]KAA0943911.1 XRE family transcriptional regulator [Pseudomonas sp. ANT_H4]KAA0951001.1 XRE family transcriptional regulator [Pseudomonas sp. ANT_H14]
MSSLAMSSTVDQQIVLHQFTPRHSVQARAMLGWSREDFSREALVEVDAIQHFESHGEVDDKTRLTLGFRLEAEGLVFFPGFAPGWGMSVRRPTAVMATAETAPRGIISRILGSAPASTAPATPQPNGA